MLCILLRQTRAWKKLTVTGMSTAVFSLERGLIMNLSLLFTLFFGQLCILPSFTHLKITFVLLVYIWHCCSLHINRSMRVFSPTTEDHQVFFNYRGEQLRYNFISHLTDAFERHEINFFVDKYEQRGKDLNNLFVRIEESRIALAIFSTRCCVYSSYLLSIYFQNI